MWNNPRDALSPSNGFKSETSSSSKAIGLPSSATNDHAALSLKTNEYTKRAPTRRCRESPSKEMSGKILAVRPLSPLFPTIQGGKEPFSPLWPIESVDETKVAGRP